MRACRRRRSGTKINKFAPVDLPHDLLLDILSRIPVRSLVRFKGVCKSWYHLLTHDPYFIIRMHLNRSVQTRGYKFLFVLANHVYALIHPAPRLKHEYIINSTINPKFISDLETGTYTYAGIEGHSCNGLFLTRITLSGHQQLLYLWNPSTREYKQLPASLTLAPKFRVAHPTTLIFGLGYDSIKDDYKVIMGVFYSSLAFQYKEYVCANVYSLRADSVKTLRPGIPFGYRSNCMQGGIFVKDSIHWLFKDFGQEMFQMLSFDVTKEDHKPVPLPDITRKILAIQSLQIGVLDNCLCLYLLDKMGTMIVLTMKEYGVKESWTNFFIVRFDRMNCRYFAALYCNDSDEVILQMSRNPGWGDLVVYKPRERRVSLVKIHALPHCFSYISPIIPYVESLVSLKPRQQ